MYKILLIFLSFAKLTCSDNPKFHIFKEIDIPTSVQTFLPYRFQFNSDGDLLMSFPRVHNDNSEPKDDIDTSLMLLKTKENKLDIYRLGIDIYSVMGFTIDKNDKLYLLDQGFILQNGMIAENTFPRLITQKKDNVEIYNFTGINLRYSLLTDVVVDHEEKYAYIIDGGNLEHDESSPGIIVLNFGSKKSYKILNNHKSFKMKGINSNFNDALKNDKIYNYFKDNIGVNSIQISCDDETIYYSSIKSKILYSVSTKDISDAIDKYEKKKNVKDLNEIDVKEINLEFISYYTLISSKNNIFAINGEANAVELSLTIDGDLTNYRKGDNQKIDYQKPGTEHSPVSIDVYNGKLYLLFTDKVEGENIKLKIYEAELNKDEFNNIVGCTIFIFKLYGGIIFLFCFFFIILCITIMIIIANSGQKLEISNLKKEMEKEAEINELNRQLNE